MNLDDLLDQIADRVATRVLARMVREVVTDDVMYTTNKRGPHLPGKSRRWMLDHIREIPGAHKVGRDWVLAASSFEEWLRVEDARAMASAPVPRPPGARRSRPSNDVAYSDDPASMQQRAERSLAAQGMRRSR